MKAGQELDALVAEKVMGMRPGVDWHSPCFDEFFCDNPCPRFSTSIAAAWEVFEWLCKRGDDIAEVVQLTFNVQNGWWCTSERWTQIDVQGNAPTAPLAICLAALKAVGVEIPAEPTSGDITLTHSSDVLV